jgi:ornithine--oxo-acid transaminase
VAMNDLDALEKELRKGDVAAFLVEPIQGKGVYIPNEHYLPEAQRLCRKYGVQFICDEVQVGLGRSGKFLGCELWNLEPDMVTIAKSLGGGYMPTSAVIMRREINNKVFGHLKRAQVHSTTFGQNDMSMAAGLATLYVMDEENIVEHSATVGAELLAKLSALKGKHEMIADVRGKGLIIGIEFRPPGNLALRAAWTAIEAAERGLFTQLVVMSLMRDHHILTQVGGPGVNIIKLLPPLIIGSEEVEMIVNAFEQIMEETRNLKGRVWAMSGELIKQAMSA